MNLLTNYMFNPFLRVELNQNLLFKNGSFIVDYLGTLMLTNINLIFQTNSNISSLMDISINFSLILKVKYKNL